MAGAAHGFQSRGQRASAVATAARRVARCWPSLALGSAALGSLALGCNSVFGINALDYDAPATAGDAGVGGCDAASCANSGQPWALRIGGPDMQITRHIAPAPDGTLVAVLDFRGAVSGSLSCADGSGDYESLGAEDMLVVKLAADGGCLWSRHFGAADSQSPLGVAVDKDGRIVVVGGLAGTVDLGGGALTSATPEQHDVFVLVLDAQGEHVWSKLFGGPGWQSAGAVAIDSAANIVLVGQFEQSLSFGSGTQTLVSLGGLDAFAAKLGPDGALLWAERYGSTADQQATAVAVDSADNVLVAGQFVGTMSVGTIPLASVGATDGFVIKLDPTGQPLWAKALGDEQPQGVWSVATDAEARVFVAGSAEGTIALDDGSTVFTSGDQDAILVAFDADGKTLCGRAFGGAGADAATAVSVDSTGAVVLGGMVATEMSFDAAVPTLSAADGGSIFVATLEPYCLARSALALQGPSTSQALFTMAVTPEDVIALGGTFEGTLSVGQTSIESAAGADAFVVGLPPP